MMKLKANSIKWLVTLLLSGSLFACQDLERPEMVIIPNPPPPTFTPLKLFLPFEGNVTDVSTYTFQTLAEGERTYPEGMNGKSVQANGNAYVLVTPPVDETWDDPNFKIGDTLRNLGSFTVAFWMNATKPNKATGIFSISNVKQFWGNLDVFLESHSSNDTEAFFKVHLFNYRTGAMQERWQERRFAGAFGQWSHVAISYDGPTSMFRFYENGIKVVESEIKDYGELVYKDMGPWVVSTLQFQTDPSLTSGTKAQDWGSNFLGKLDQFRFYNKAIGDAEIKELVDAKK